VVTSAPVLWIQWALGMVAVEAYWGRVRLPGWCASWTVALAWAAVAKACDLTALWWLGPALWGLTFFTVLNAATRADTEGRWRGRLARALSALGVMSYSLYLVHYPVRAVMKHVLTVAAEPGMAAYVMTAALMIVTACVAARVFFVLVERRFLTRGANAATGWSA